MTTKALFSVLLLAFSAAPIFAQPALLTHMRPVSCRMMDTRIVGGAIQENEIRIFSVDPLFSALQGGVSNCGVPSEAMAVKINIKGSSVTADGGYFRVFNVDASTLGTYSTLQLKEPGTWIAVQMDSPVSGNLLVAVHSLVQAHAIVDLVGWYTAAPEP